MGKVFRQICLGLIVMLFVTGVSGCGYASKASVEKKTAKVEQKHKEDKEAVLRFVNDVTPLMEEADKLHKATMVTVQKFGYREIDIKQALGEVNRINTATEQIRNKLNSVEATGDMEEIKGEFSTSLYLKHQKIIKLQKILQEPNPKSSTLNKVLDELRGSEGFLEKSKGRVQSLKQSVGIGA